jgi:PAS domain S-box-containing protein
MLDFLNSIFDTSDFTPRRQCGNWSAELVRLHNVSDALIWLAYLAIPIVLLYMTRRRRDLPFPAIFVLFAAFIVFCGSTHFFEVVVFYWPAYRLIGLVKLATAVVSWATVIALIPIVPRALALQSPERLEREIVERKRAEMRSSGLLDAAPDAVVVVDQTGRIVLVNAQTEALFGYDRSELLGREIELLIPDRYHGAHRSFRDTFFTSPRARPMGGGRELFARRNDGSEFPAEISLSPFQTEHETLVSSSIRDCTERRQVERTLSQQAKLLDASNKELEAFSYSVSHDLRAPLRAIDGFSRILLDDYSANIPAEAKHYLANVRANAQQMGRLVDGLLNLSRLIRVPIATQLVDSGAMVRTVIDEQSDACDGRRIVFAIDELPGCRAEPTLLKQVWTNLIANAIKYTRGKNQARIEIGALSANSSAAGPTYFVKDNGVGFDMRYAGRMFGVFQRLHRSEDFEGTGVGLAIVQRIVNRHGGRVWAEGQPGQGATFFFTLDGGIDHEQPFKGD